MGECFVFLLHHSSFHLVLKADKWEKYAGCWLKSEGQSVVQGMHNCYVKVQRVKGRAQLSTAVSCQPWIVTINLKRQSESFIFHLLILICFLQFGYKGLDSVSYNCANVAAKKIMSPKALKPYFLCHSNDTHTFLMQQTISFLSVKINTGQVCLP